MQFNLQVTILKMEDGVSFAQWHFFWDKHANPDPPQRHTQVPALPMPPDWFHNL